MPFGRAFGKVFRIVLAARATDDSHRVFERDRFVVPGRASLEREVFFGFHGRVVGSPGRNFSGVNARLEKSNPDLIVTRAETMISSDQGFPWGAECLH
jgi:hypothetical protein